MAFASGGGLGTGNEKVSDQSISVTFTGSVSVGDLVCVWVALDSNVILNVDTSAFNQGVNCVDTKGNIYCSVYSQDGASPAGSHARGALFIARVTTALTTSDSVTITVNVNTTAKAVSIHKFTMDTSKRWAVVNNGPANAITTAADPAALTLSGLTSREYLLLHLLAGEGPQTDAYTWDTDYTQITGDGTTGGVDDTNIHVRGGYRIATLTTDTVDVTSTTADRDYVQGFVAICEVDYDATFPAPTSAIYDDFNRANESPLDGGLWDTTHPAAVATAPPGSSNAGDVCELTNNACDVLQDAHIDNNSGSYTLVQVPAASDCDVFATVTTIPTNSSVAQGGGNPNTNPGNRGFGVGLYLEPGETRDGLQGGVEAKWERPGRLWPTGVDRIRFGEPQNFTTLPYLTAHVNMANGYRLGVQLRGSFAHLWIDRGSGWEWVGAVDERTTLSGISVPTCFTVLVSGTETVVDDFGCGPLAVVFVPQIYRRPFG